MVEPKKKTYNHRIFQLYLTNKSPLQLSIKSVPKFSSKKLFRTGKPKKTRGGLKVNKCGKSIEKGLAELSASEFFLMIGDTRIASVFFGKFHNQFFKKLIIQE